MCPQVSESDSFQYDPVDMRRLLPPPTPSSPASARGGACSGGAHPAVRGVGCNVDLPLLDFAASFGWQVFDLLLRLQIKHHVSELLLELSYRHVL